MRFIDQLSAGLAGLSKGRRSMVSYGSVALVAAAADLLSKQAAVSMLDERVVPLADRLSLMVVFNTASAGSVMLGEYTAQLNVLVTAAALLLITCVVSALALIDRRATWALGLVAGGAIGNLASMLAGPAGVADFLALRVAPDRSIVMNVADLALWSGAALLGPVVLTLVRAIRAERRAPAGALIKA